MIIIFHFFQVTIPVAWEKEDKEMKEQVVI